MDTLIYIMLHWPPLGYATIALLFFSTFALIAGIISKGGRNG